MGEIVAVKLIVLAFAVSGLSVTIAKAHVTNPVRAFVKRHSKLFGDLLECPYCLSHWIALGFWSATYPQVVITGSYVTDIAVYVFGLVALAAIITGTIMRALLRHEAEVAELRHELDASRELLREVIAERT